MKNYDHDGDHNRIHNHGGIEVLHYWVLNEL